ncbi:MAG: hypothetical protein FJ045_04455 [Crenarchaeota archaeon]|nr:hypothetical protein [Thermoproteota archaeon]
MAKVKVVGVTKHPKKHVRKVVAKAVEARLREVITSVAKVEKSLRDFETKYGMATESFYKRHLSGELQENMDFMEWRACKEILDDLLEEKALLEEIST